MYEIELKNVAANLPLLLAEVDQDDEIVLTDAHHPIAKIIKLEAKTMESAQERGAKAAALLEQLAQRNTFSEIVDPVAWQRETRQDRQLPGRE
jgi:antitoxin (DNA-binding transcriptional repressor) of toxin-antitoxin stability system